MIKIICIGKIKEKFYRDAISEYLKRLSKYTKIEIIELNDSSTNSVIVDLEKERDLIMNYIKDKDYVITLEIDGNMLDSNMLASKIDKTLISNPNITFIIGGSNGIHDDIKKISNYPLSFSKLTFPHQLFRVFLLEQIYRSFKIIKNESYHK